jgi:hypothetical protein
MRVVLNNNLGLAGKIPFLLYRIIPILIVSFALSSQS